ncbi:MAG: endonuclease/exonuclease/phosphatase family protein [Deltaproteobacteria bacterium]|nr:endonuclease/exonuclease/phosphatase family protein [Deltaproteobacteria bacterium]
MARFRVMTYNVHRCVGADGRDSVSDIAEVCREAEADIIALQELDAPETDLDEGVHHARDLATHLEMKLIFCRTFRRGVGYYGHALLSRHPIELVKVTTFASPHVDAEPRGAIWARVTFEGPMRALDIVSTHLGVHRTERAMQSRELLGEGWLGSPTMRRPLVLCGDLNAVPNAATYRRFATRLRDAQRVLGRRPKATFPAKLPVLRLDHVFVSEDLNVRGVSVPWNGRSRRASDHLPLIVDLELEAR